MGQNPCYGDITSQGHTAYTKNIGYGIAPMTTNPLDSAEESPIEPLHNIEDKADLHDNICYGSVAPTTTNPLDCAEDKADMHDNICYGSVAPTMTSDVNASNIDDTEDMQDNSGYRVVSVMTNPQDYISTDDGVDSHDSYDYVVYK